MWSSFPFHVLSVLYTYNYVLCDVIMHLCYTYIPVVLRTCHMYVATSILQPRLRPCHPVSSSSQWPACMGEAHRDHWAFTHYVYYIISNDKYIRIQIINNKWINNINYVYCSCIFWYTSTYTCASQAHVQSVLKSREQCSKWSHPKMTLYFTHNILEGRQKGFS